MLGPELLVHVPAALWECWDPSYWCSYQRRCVNAGPKGSTQEWAAPAGRPTRRLAGAVRRTVLTSGNPAVIFLTRQVPSSTSRWSLYTVSAHVARRPAWFDFDCAVSEVVATIALLFLPPLLVFSRRFSFLCSLTAAHRFRRIFHFGIFGRQNMDANMGRFSTSTTRTVARCVDAAALS